MVLTAYPELARQLDVDALRLQPFDPGAMVWRHGKGHVVSDPFRRPRHLFATAMAPLGSPYDKVRLLKLRQRVRSVPPADLLRGTDISTLKALEEAGFTSRIIERFWRPLFAGIQLDPSLGTSRRMFDVIFRCLADGDAAVPAAGMEAIPRQLAAGLPPGRIHLGTRVAGVEGQRVWTVDGWSIDARAVVVATEGPQAARLLGLPDVGSNSVSCVYFAADRRPRAHQARHPQRIGERPGPERGHHERGGAVVRAGGPDARGRRLSGRGVDGPRGRRAVAAGGVVGSAGGPVAAPAHVLDPHGQPDQRPPLHPKQRSTSAAAASCAATIATRRRSRAPCSPAAAAARPSPPPSRWRRQRAGVLR